MVKVSIILVSYNTCKLTLDTISSIYKETKNLDFEIILVDNDSKDNTVKEVETDYKLVKVIKNNINAGFGSANNIGVKYASGEYIFLLNTDTILLNNAVKILSDYLDVNKDVVASAGNLYDQKKNPATSYSKLFPSLASELNQLFFNFTALFHRFNAHFNYSDKPIKFKGSLSGADAMIRKDIFNLVGGFDEDFFLYYEETELFYRMTNLGHYVASVPDAKIIHLEGASESVKNITLKRSLTSKYIYLDKHSTLMKIVIHHILFNLTAISRALIFSLKGDAKRTQFWNTLRNIEKEVYAEFNRKVR
ncbi:glycosyltransferase family 2 protein [Shewanella baltica]|uniref:glycosyltransferase family 2 protein n=1 Tax=Shewanella baltica TaxID=62322 RepID=UPI00217D4440|nr:glycosyltransferase family 2 protein [Shewanella baltica]MCS6229730.1 glycosyltransferase family 2 protein [Shewanella baltica]